MTMGRRRGTGSIEKVPGGHRPRLPGHGERLDVFPTHEAAEDALEDALRELAAQPARGGLTLGAWGEACWERREKEGQRAAGDYASAWKSQVASCWLADVALVAVRREDVVRWCDELAVRRVKPGRGYSEAAKAARATRTISKSRAQNALNTVRIALADAVERGLLVENVAHGVQLPRAIRKRPRRDKGWSYLLEEEVWRLLACQEVPERERLAAAFAIGTGARETEQWGIAWRDIDFESQLVTLRETKSGVPRTVPMLPIALAAANRWRSLTMAALKRRPALDALVFLSERGCPRVGEPHGWGDNTLTAGLIPEGRHDGRHVRWHDLRHTCGTALVQGWWGEPWTLEAVREQLGHESVTTTERYAHLAGTLAKRSAATMHYRPSDRPTRRKGVESDPAGFPGSHFRDLNSRPTVYEVPPEQQWIQALEGHSGPTEGRATDLATKILTTLANGGAITDAQVVELAQTVLLDAGAHRVPKLRLVVGGRA